jgi:predicted helicase
MPHATAFKTYLHDLEHKLTTGDATERTYYSSLETLLGGVGEDLTIINEPKRIRCGAPDFIITRGQTPLGYVEAKDVGANLDPVESSDQVDRYLDSLNNLILTNYLEFRWFVEGEHRETAKLGTLTRDGRIRRRKGGVDDVSDLLEGFLDQQVPTIGRPVELAERMAALARTIRGLIKETFRQEREHGRLHEQLTVFRKMLIPDITPAQFADMYAQTITYGLFAARVHVSNGTEFKRQDAWTNLPRTNPFLRRFFNEVAGPDMDPRIAWAVDDLANLLAHADMAEVLRDFGRRTRQEDPVVHFYETFLATYDPEMRRTRGVFYTPEPVVSFLVRSIDHILKTRFDRPVGLADKDVLILDPAVGTATFLYFVIQEIRETLETIGVTGAWNDYVKNHLLPRIFGFELLMAPYTVAHMKLGIQLRESGYEFDGDQRLGIYLTNALEKPVFREEVAAFARYITQEANAAAEVKRDKPIMVVLGNPPYSVSSANKGDYIEDLMDRYKEAVRDEQNIQPLSDDYIKFIRFAHDRIERTGHGVIGMITNHSYLSGLIHRGMREELLKTFDEIYVLNLHGNALMGETAPDGGPDDNVFDIRQGVAISLFVRRERRARGASDGTRVCYADLWGLRDEEYHYLIENDVGTTEWQRLEPTPPYYFFVPKDFDLLSEYERGWRVTDIFPIGSRGIETGKDEHLVAFKAHSVERIVRDIADPSTTLGDLQELYGIEDTSGWPVSKRRGELLEKGFTQSKVTKVLHRPFDLRYTYFSDFLRRTHSEVMKHMLHENLGLLAMRQVVGPETYSHWIVTQHIADNRVFFSNRGAAVLFPLYLYTTPEETAGTLFATDEITREPNLSSQFTAAVEQTLGLRLVTDSRGDLQETVGPEDILRYAYAVFHSPTYRERYAEFLKIDFPRLPITSDRELLAALAEKGEELVTLHLMESPELDQSPVRFPVADSNEVASHHPRYLAPGETEPGSGCPLDEGRVYINETQYFEGIDPEVWEFEIGGYQVLHKWLKDRKRADYALSYDDVEHYRRMVVALQETMRLMEEIDALIPKWPIE